MINIDFSTCAPINSKRFIIAMECFPILVRQAKIGRTITYSQLGLETNHHHRSFMYPLGVIGAVIDTINKLIKKGSVLGIGESVPMINTIVVNSSTFIPGDGIAPFVNWDWGKSSNTIKKRMIRKLHDDVFLYPYWDEVIQLLGLHQKTIVSNLITYNRKSNGSGNRGGEGKRHKELKEYIFNHPELLHEKNKHLLKLKLIQESCQMEKLLPTGDKVDVYFETKNQIVAVEVKSDISDISDLERGLFQCFKYQKTLELIEALGYINQTPEREVVVVLVCGGSFDKSLIPLKNSIGIGYVFDGVKHD